ncbi:MAG: AraC family transcriptional regulator [Pseudomonadota bacterium]
MQVVHNKEISSADGVVYARALKGFMDLAEALGASSERVARKAGLDLNLLKVPDALIPVATFYRIHEEILAETDNTDFGLLSGRVSYMESAQLFLYLASASQTLRDWMNMLPSVSSLLGDLGEVRVARLRDHFALQWHPVQAPDPVRCLVTDGLLSATALQMDSYCLLPVRPDRVDFTYPKPDDTAMLENTFRAPLHFDQEVSALYYDWKLLDNPQQHISTPFHEKVVEEFSTYFSNDASATDQFSLSLHTAIRRQLPAGGCSIDSIASDLNVSRRTLQRRLKERNNNFQQLFQHVKSDLAEKYLNDDSLSIIEIALLLGYGDPSSFSSAFKSWKGVTPSEYRRQ